MYEVRTTKHRIAIYTTKEEALARAAQLKKQGMTVYVYAIKPETQSQS